MGGEITVKSAPGHGAVFGVRLPDQALQGAPQRAEMPAVAAPGSLLIPVTGSSPRVLVIDDDLNALDVMRRFLSKEGFDILTAQGGRGRPQARARGSPLADHSG